MTIRTKTLNTTIAISAQITGFLLLTLLLAAPVISVFALNDEQTETKEAAPTQEVIDPTDCDRAPSLDLCKENNSGSHGPNGMMTIQTVAIPEGWEIESSGQANKSEMNSIDQVVEFVGDVDSIVDTSSSIVDRASENEADSATVEGGESVQTETTDDYQPVASQNYTLLFHKLRQSNFELFFRAFLV